MEYRFPYKGKWVVTSDKEMREKGIDARSIEGVRLEYQKFCRNRLSYFLPHGLAWSDGPRPAGDTGKVYRPACYPEEYGNDGVGLINSEFDISVLFSPNKTGKEQPYNAKVQTPSGETEMGALRVGDVVLGGDGKPCCVTGIFEQGVKPVYLFDLGLGLTVESGLEHIWPVSKNDPNDPTQLLTTADIIASPYDKWFFSRHCVACGVTQKLPLVRMMLTEKRKCRCITVDSPDHTYLTDDFIVTHNTYQTGAAICFRAIPCDKKWHAFQYHGIKWREWPGPILVRMFSFTWDTTADLWQRYRELLPAEELREYSQEWMNERYGLDKGRNPRRYAKDITSALKSGKAQTIQVACGTLFSFGSYSQADTASEAYECDLVHFDEQPTKGVWNGFLRGQQTRGDTTQAFFSATPRVMKERPHNTGSAGFVVRELCTGKNTAGMTVGQYYVTIPCVPDAIITPKKKRIAYDKWANPKIERSAEEERQALARYYGLPQPGGGTVVDNYFPQHHLIPPFDLTTKVFKDSSKYRGVDHGLTRPCAGVWAACFQFQKWQYLVVYREYFSRGGIVPTHAAALVKLSGGRREKAEPHVDEASGEMWNRYREKFGDETYISSVLDSRSFGTPSTEKSCTIGESYNDWGFDCRPAAGTANEKPDGSGLLDLMRTFFEMEKERPHIMYWFARYGLVTRAVYDEWLKSRNGDWHNGSRIAIVTECTHVREELDTWVRDPATDKPRSENDHHMAALKYIAGENPQYWGDFWDAGRLEREEAIEEDAMPGRKYIR